MSLGPTLAAIRSKWVGKFAIGTFAAILSGTLFTPQAYALNGFSYVVSCTSCATTSDFSAAAVAQAQALVSPGTYVVVSGSNPTTAYIRISGTIRAICKPPSCTLGHGPTTLELTSITSIPVDGSGNSLSGQPESTLQANYGSYDQSIFGFNRNGKVGTVNADPDYQVGFVCGCDLTDMGGQVSNWIAAQYGSSVSAALPINSVVTVQFQDGSSAIFYKASQGGTLIWLWTGIAHNKKGQLIDQNGNVRTNPNTSGAGGGTASAPAPATNLVLTLGGAGECVTDTTVSQGGEIIGYEMHYVPC